MTPSSVSSSISDPRWEIVSAALGDAATEHQLVVHWFDTPEDSSVNVDEHFGANERTAKFLRVVVPTLADQLAASGFWVAVPWDLDRSSPLMVLLSSPEGRQPTIEAREVRRAPDPGPPWWRLGRGPVDPPRELQEIAARMQLRAARRPAQIRSGRSG